MKKSSSKSFTRAILTNKYANILFFNNHLISFLQNMERDEISGIERSGLGMSKAEKQLNIKDLHVK